jgi:hypothetical protein
MHVICRVVKNSLEHVYTLITIKFWDRGRERSLLTIKGGVTGLVLSWVST